MNTDDLKEFEKENIDAMERLFTEKESTDTQNQNRYRYYADLYGNEYRWTTHKQEDGKFHATYLKLKVSRNWHTLNVKKTRYFTKRSSAKAWCLKLVRKANKHQKIVIDARAVRKQQRLDAKPKLTPAQKAIKIAESKIQHYKKLQVKCSTKMKSLVTRQKTYHKRIKYYQKRILGFQAQHLVAV